MKQIFYFTLIFVSVLLFAGFRQGEQGQDRPIPHLERRGADYVGFASVEEGEYVDNRWVPGRRLNGDDIMLNYHLAEEAAQRRAGSVIRMGSGAPEIFHVKLYHFN